MTIVSLTTAAKSLANNACRLNHRLPKGSLGAGSEQRQLAGEGEVAEGAGGLELVDELSTKARMMERSAEQIVDEILKNVEMPVIRKSREGV